MLNVTRHKNLIFREMLIICVVTGISSVKSVTLTFYHGKKQHTKIRFNYENTHGFVIYFIFTIFTILGNMWGQSWSALTDLLLPFPNTTFLDVTTALNDQVKLYINSFVDIFG